MMDNCQVITKKGRYLYIVIEGLPSNIGERKNKGAQHYLQCDVEGEANPLASVSREALLKGL